jgi:hypothetical protein
MEVHHHAHPADTGPGPAGAGHRKKWTHYLWEFIMLFLAVFCGFLAENFREHNIENHREKQYIKSLVADLKNDQQILLQHIKDLKSGRSMMDSLINVLNSPAGIANSTGNIYYWGRLGPRLQPLVTNNRTFEQLKNSGNFRLIEDMNISNKIMNYYEKLPLVKLLESINETEFTEYKKIAAKIFHPAIFLAMEGTDGVIRRTNENPSLRTMDPELLQELSVFALYLRGTKNGILNSDEELLRSATELMEYLQKEYHVE